MTTPTPDAVPSEEFRIKRLREWAHQALLRQPGGSIIERTVAEDMMHLEAKLQRDLAAAQEALREQTINANSGRVERELWAQKCDELEAAQEALKAARLFIAETGDNLPDPMYIETVNREGLAEDCKQFATGEVCAKYLDVKWQTDRAIRAEALAESNARDAELGQILMRYIDRLDDPVPDDALPDIVAALIKDAMAAIDAAREGK